MVRGNSARTWLLGALGVLFLTGIKPGQAPAVFETAGDQVFVRPFCGTGRGLNACASVMASGRTLASTRIQKHLDDAKQGKLVNPAGLGIEEDAYLKDAFMQTPVCLPGESGSLSSCGTTCQFTCTADSSGNLACKTPDPKTCQAERALLRGALHQTVQRLKDETGSSLLAEGKLLLGAKCKSIAKDPANVALETEFQAAVNDFSSVHGDRAIKCDAKAGDAAKSPAGGVVADVEEASKDFSSCYLHGARYALETLVAHSLVCETFARASDRWPSIQGYMQGNSKATAEESVRACKDQGKNQNATQLAQCLNETYASRIRAAYQRRWEEAYGYVPVFE